MKEMINLLIHGGFLTVLGISDIRKRTVSVAVLAAYFGAAFGWSIGAYGFDVERMILGAVPAGLILLLKKPLKLGIGGGDIAVLAVAGVTLGFGTAAGAVLIASLACAGVFAVRIMLKKADRKSRMAFIPFMGIGVAVAGLLG